MKLITKMFWGITGIGFLTAIALPIIVGPLPKQAPTPITETKKNKESSLAYKLMYGDKNKNKNLSGAKLTEWKSSKVSDKDFTANIILDVLLKNGMISKTKMGANPKKELKDCLDSFIKASNNDVLKSQDISSLGMLCAFQMGWK